MLTTEELFQAAQVGTFRNAPVLHDVLVPDAAYENALVPAEGYVVVEIIRLNFDDNLQQSMMRGIDVQKMTEEEIKMWVIPHVIANAPHCVFYSYDVKENTVYFTATRLLASAPSHEEAVSGAILFNSDETTHPAVVTFAQQYTDTVRRLFEEILAEAKNNEEEEGDN